MKELNKIFFPLLTLKTQQKLSDKLAPRFQLEQGPTLSNKFKFYDDYDHHLWHANLLLYSDSKKTLWLFNNVTTKLEKVQTPNKVKFYWDLPSGHIKDILAKRIGFSALMAKNQLLFTETSFGLRDRNDKLVIRLKLITHDLNGEQSNYLMLQELRGYEKEYHSVLALLNPSQKALIKQEVLPFLLSTLNDFPNNVIQLKNPTLSKEMPTERAVRSLAGAMMSQAEVQVPGLIDDIDTERLHQYRVHLRKTRSLISLLKKALPNPTAQWLKSELGTFSRHTNRLRDLDVFLLARTQYESILPPGFEAGISELYKEVERQRTSEFKKVKKYFSSVEYLDRSKKVIEDINEKPIYSNLFSTTPIEKSAKALMLTRYKKMLSMSNAINSSTPDDEVHELRLEFKKLRYLIEFFSDLLPKRKTADIISVTKKIQTKLGDFNDYCTQIEFLMPFSDDAKIEMSKALSGLVAAIYQRKIHKRTEVESAISEYFTNNMTTKFELLFDTEYQEKKS